MEILRLSARFFVSPTGSRTFIPLQFFGNGSNAHLNQNGIKFIFLYMYNKSKLENLND